MKSFLEICHEYRKNIELINDGIKNHKILELSDMYKFLIELNDPIFYDKYIIFKRKLDVYSSMLSTECLTQYLAQHLPQYLE